MSTSPKQKVLIINSYAGSLTVGAHAVKGVEIIGSYEDSGFGLKVQRANFPDLDYRETAKAWPEQSLKGVVVLAHPPCSAFSSQTTSSKKGADSDAFACTKRVMRYAMGHDAAAIAIESVQPAMEGAWDVHADYARRYGYHLYRVLQNAVSFGVPQWRPRFWAIFVKQRRGVPVGTYFSVPTPAHYTTIGDVLEDVSDPGPVLPAVHNTIQRHLRKLLDAGYTSGDLALISRATGRIHQIVKRLYHPDESQEDVRNRYFPGYFGSYLQHYLDPDGFAPVLLHDSLWIYKGRVCSIADYNALMGFPRDYVFPAGTLSSQRKYLSKGVCPPVATWVLQSIIDNLQGKAPSRATQPTMPGEVANFNLKKSQVNTVAA